MTDSDDLVRDVAHGDAWTLYLDDSCERLAALATDSVDLSVCSPPFAQLYNYSPSPRDLSNSRTRGEFFDHYRFIIREQLRVTRPGRIAAVHVADITLQKVLHDVIGLTDFSGEVVSAFVTEGWIFDGRVTIDKDPQAQAIRTKSHSLLFVTKDRDASMLRPALPDYLLKFRKPGDNPVPVKSDVTNEEWIAWARPVWMDIRETNTLNTRVAKEDADERHICLAAGSLVLTRDGYLPIEGVEPGTEVLTHAGRWQPVLAKRCNGIEPVIRTCAQGVADLRTTADHKLWTRRGGGAKAKARARATEPAWVAASDVLGSYLNLKLPPVEDVGLTETECWIAGRWLGDGHRASARRRSGTRGGTGQFVISCSYAEEADLLAQLGEHAGHVAHTPTATQVALRDLSPTLRRVLARCGEGAHEKRVPGELLTLPAPKAEALLSGYLSADGHYVDRYDRWTASSVSRALLLGMAMVAQRARGVVASVYAGRPARKAEIDGRVVECRQDWVFGFRNSTGYRQSGWIGEDGAWKKVRRSEPAGNAEVWDLRVAGDASFVAEGAVVKNCPLQLDLIERCVRLWSNRGETVLSPFAGIGSEVYTAVKLGRYGVGIELKGSYWRTAVDSLRRLEHEMAVPTLFDAPAGAVP